MTAVKKAPKHRPKRRPPLGGNKTTAQPEARYVLRQLRKGQLSYLSDLPKGSRDR